VTVNRQPRIKNDRIRFSSTFAHDDDFIEDIKDVAVGVYASTDGE
jgi:hypothetical protein